MNRLLPITALSIALVAPTAQSAAAHHVGVSPVRQGTATEQPPFHLAAGSTCHKQLANDDGLQISSQNWEPARDRYDARGADDFTLTRSCTVSEVDVVGEYVGGSGPPDSMHVTFYLDEPGRPGAIRSNQRHLAVVDPAGNGSFQIQLRRPVTFAPGTYWVAVQANMDYHISGGWYWRSNTKATGHDSMWRNPADGFRTGCTTWTETATCVQASFADFLFALVK